MVPSHNLGELMKTPLKTLKLDINKYVQDVIVGPQGELFEKLKEINQGYGVDLRIKNNFTWARGSFKQAIEAGQKMYIRKRGKTILDPFKFTHAGNYQKERFVGALAEINRKMWILRGRNLKVHDSSVDAMTMWQQFLDHMWNSIKIANKYDDNIEIMLWADDLRGNKDSLLDHTGSILYDGFPPVFLEIIVRFKNNITIKIMDDANKEVLDEVDTYPMSVKMYNNIFSMFNGWCSHYEKTDEEKYALINRASRRVSRYANNRNSWKGRYETPYFGLCHPFISNRYRHNNSLFDIEEYLNLCFGDFQGDINMCTDMLDFLSLVHNLNLWRTTYILGRTNPLNQPSYWRYGIPKGVSKERATNIGLDTQWCYNNLSYNATYMNESQKHCDKIECQLKDQCYSYKEMEVSSKHVDIIDDNYIEEVANMLMNYICNSLERDRLLSTNHDFKYDPEEEKIHLNAVNSMKSHIIADLCDTVNTRFRGYVRTGLNIVNDDNYYRHNKARHVSNETRSSWRSMDAAMGKCKMEFRKEHHNKYDRLINEISLWEESYGKLRKDIHDKMVEPPKQTKQEEAWIAMLKRTGQPLTTPIGR